jgi:hypothetical protein
MCKVVMSRVLYGGLAVMTVFGSLATASALAASGAVAHANAHVPVTGYDAKWKFNANDGTPIVTISVS